MNGIIESGKNIIGGADGPTSVFIAGKVSAGVSVIAVIIGLILCFLGLKLARILITLNALLIGLAAGITIAAVINVDKTVFVVIMLGCAAVTAALSFFLYKFGVFCMVFTGTTAFAVSLTGLAGGNFGILSFTMGFGSREIIIGAAVLVISFILSVFAVKFAEPMLIIITALNGGISSGISFRMFLTTAADFAVPVWAGYAAGMLFAVFGMLVQFMMHSRKIGKKEKSYADEIKEKVSVESEVKKARTVLEDDEEE